MNDRKKKWNWKTDSRAGEEKVQMSLKHSAVPESKSSSQREMEGVCVWGGDGAGWEYVKGTDELTWKSSQWSELEQFKKLTKWYLLDHNQGYKINIQEFIMISMIE